MDRDGIKMLLSALNSRLAAQDQHADILIAGGASIAMLIDDTRVTHDIDAVILSTDLKQDVLKYAEGVGNVFGLESSWFNEAVKGFVDLSWKKQDLNMGFSNLNVYSVPPEQLLAMKLYSARTDTRDLEDCKKLMNYLSLASEMQALQILRDNIPEQLLTAKMQYFTQMAYEEYVNECTYTLDEIYDRADGAAHLSPELKAKDEALWEISKWIENESGENPYKLAEENRIDSAEDAIFSYIEFRGVTPLFNDRGSIIRLDHQLPEALQEIERASGKDVRRRDNGVEDNNKVSGDQYRKEMRKMPEYTGRYAADEKSNMKKVYISLNKKFCYQGESKIYKGQIYNKMTLPKGTIVDGKDIGGKYITPMYMKENQYNPSEMTATYYVDPSERLKINLYSNGNIEKVDVEELKAAVDAQKAQFRQQVKEKAEAREQNKEKAEAREQNKEKAEAREQNKDKTASRAKEKDSGEER